jgi:hypothetical protein
MKFHVMNYHGHDVIEFDKSQTSEAMEKFMELVNTGYTPAIRNEGQRDYSVSRNYREADEILFVPHLRGG